MKDICTCLNSQPRQHCPSSHRKRALCRCSAATRVPASLMRQLGEASDRASASAALDQTSASFCFGQSHCWRRPILSSGRNRWTCLTRPELETRHQNAAEKWKKVSLKQAHSWQVLRVARKPLSQKKNSASSVAYQPLFLGVVLRGGRGVGGPPRKFFFI